ncbi:S1 family peptidase [Archangium lansingense]|uniref:S1 family peptidase n=1 Tax=Archangium lansingense TaxID=2995310 RepID=UPI003B794180
MRRSYVVAMAAVAWLGCQVQVEEAAVQGSEVLSTGQEIINGTPASLGQFPWQARWEGPFGMLCNGSLIHPSWVLTTATCAMVGANPANMWIVLGDLEQFGPAEPTQQGRSASRIVIHPGYDLVSGEPVNDLALIKLSTPATLNSAVQTIAIQSATASNTLHTVSGWGGTYYGDTSSSNVLRYASIPVTSNASCDGAPLGRDLLPGELCAGYLNGYDGACHHDTGAPLITQGSPPQQVGIVSWGRGDCNTYTVFTRLSSYASWIDGHVNCVPCPMANSWYDGANCYVASPPAGTTAFIYNNNLYYTALPGNQCPLSGSWYDGANCYVGWPPAGTTAFVYNNNLYYTPVCQP